MVQDSITTQTTGSMKMQSEGAGHTSVLGCRRPGMKSIRVHLPKDTWPLQLCTQENFRTLDLKGTIWPSGCIFYRSLKGKNKHTKGKVLWSTSRSLDHRKLIWDNGHPWLCLRTRLIPCFSSVSCPCLIPWWSSLKFRKWKWNLGRAFVGVRPHTAKPAPTHSAPEMLGEPSTSLTPRVGSQEE